MPGFLTPKTYYCRKQSKFHKVHKKAFFNSKNIVIKDSQIGGLLCFFSIKSITYSNEDETQEKKKNIVCKRKMDYQAIQTKKIIKNQFFIFKESSNVF